MEKIWPADLMPPPTIIGKPGGLLDAKLIFDIKDDAKKVSPNRQIIGLCCIGNHFIVYFTYLTT